MPCRFRGIPGLDIIINKSLLLLCQLHYMLTTIPFVI
nr:MAG TPA: hypothetical protein [Caudoviricetes sp.]